MATGSLTLLEGAKYGTSVLKRGFVETLIQESPILEMIPFIPFSGNALEVTVEASLPEVEFRQVNQTWNKSWGTDTKRLFGVSILGGEVFIDNYILKVQSNVASVKARQYAKFAKSMSRTFDKNFFDGDGTGDSFYGLKALIADGLGTHLETSTTGGPLTLDDLDKAFDALRSQSSPDVLLMNRVVRRKITNLARDTHQGISLIDVGTDVFGRKVTEYNGTPIRIIGDDRDGNPILPFTENPSGDSGGDTTSVYLVAFGAEENVCGLSGLGGSLEVRDFGETEAAPGHLGRVEWYPGIAIYNPYSVVRLGGITNA